MKEKILEIRNLTFGYRQEKVLEKLNFDLYSGDFIALIGANGSGKSTLVKLILHQLEPEEGRIALSSEMRKEDMGYVPQLAIGSSQDFPITVSELVSLSLYQDIRGFHWIRARHKRAIHSALHQVGMEDYKDQLYSQLSGGQRQRVLIAKALVNQPKFLILDEPTNGIDRNSREKLLELLHHFNQRHQITILMITHDLEEVQQYLTKVYQLRDGRIEKVI